MITGPDSAAQIPIQAAEYIRRFGALVPFEISPPLLPVLIAALGLAGVPAAAGYVVVVVAAYLGGCAAVYVLVRRFQPGSVAAFGALLFALAPSRFPPASLESGSLLLCWSLAPLLLIVIDSLRRQPSLLGVGAALAVAGLMWASNPPGVDQRAFLAAGELVLVLAACLIEAAVIRQVVLAGFVVAAGWTLFFTPSRERIPPEFIARTQNRADISKTFGATSLDVEMNPVHVRAVDVISAPGRIDASLLWLRALAVGSLVSDDRQKFGAVLERLDQQDSWCVYGLADPNPAPAVLASRRQWKNLPPIRGVYDIEGLSHYVAWSGRPEPAGFRRCESSIEIEAELGPLDVFLVRRNCQPGWRAYLEDSNPRELVIECDPLGYMVVDPGRQGATRVRLAFEPSWAQRLSPEGMAPRPLPGGDFPRITPGGITEAVEFKPPPFQPGASLSIFGHNFVPGQTQVFFGNAAGDTLWVGPTQVNVRLPEAAGAGELSVVVEAAGRRSLGETIEIGE